MVRSSSTISKTAVFCLNRQSIYKIFNESNFKGASTDGLYFIAPCFNELILDQLKIGTYKVDNNLYSPYKQKPIFTVMEK